MLYRGGTDWANIPSRREVFPREAVTLDDLVDHIDHVSQLAGQRSPQRHRRATRTVRAARDGAPHEIDTVADYQKLAAVLDRRGYSQEDVERIMFRNWQRFYERGRCRSRSSRNGGMRASIVIVASAAIHVPLPQRGDHRGAVLCSPAVLPARCTICPGA